MNPRRVSSIEDLEARLHEWEHLGRELETGGEDYAVGAVATKNAFDHLVPDELEKYFQTDPSRFRTLEARLRHTKEYIANYKARKLSAEVKKQAASAIHEVAHDKPKPDEKQNDEYTWLDNATKEDVIMYMKGKEQRQRR